MKIKNPILRGAVVTVLLVTAPVWLIPVGLALLILLLWFSFYDGMTPEQPEGSDE